MGVSNGYLLFCRKFQGYIQHNANNQYVQSVPYTMREFNNLE